jgi:N-acetylneuraminic acid mutarotase
MVAGKAYLIGGRGVHRTDVFDPADNTWTAKSQTPKEMNHMQCVAYNNSVYIAGGWYGQFPYEQNHEEMFVYDIASDSWSTRPYLPNNPERRRGGAAFVLSDDGKMYLVGGNIGGHGSHSKSQALFDVYDPVRNTWNERGMMPDAIHKRDHTGGAMVSGKLCVASGRDGGQTNFFNSPVLPVDCFNFQTRMWNAGPNMPNGRAGAAVGQDRSGRLVVAGGEGFGRAYSNVDVFDGHSWNSIAPLNTARHGTGLAIGLFNCGFMYIAAGVGVQGGSNELSTTERFLPSGTAALCRPR